MRVHFQHQALQINFPGVVAVMFMDTETGMYYLQSRYYDPEAGRFINADDVGYIGVSGTTIGYNAFAYCENEPIFNMDYDGRYNRNAAVAYAERYTKWYRPWNLSYYYYTSGDCTNFVSQCLYAGGIQMTDRWYGYRNKKGQFIRSDSWSLVEPMRRYFANWKYIRQISFISFYGGGYSYQTGSEKNIISTLSSLHKGDIIFIDFKFDKKAIYTHTVIINRLSGDDIFYAAHTSRRWNESLKKHIKNGEIEKICILVFKDNAI